ncbi:MAG: hypothetical protein QM796_14415 [Chthoniobacteraceae bacterium]
MNAIFYFIRYLLTRFAKTFGCLFLIAGFGTAAIIYEMRAPMVEAARYRQSFQLTEKLQNLQATYQKTQNLVMQFKQVNEFPAPQSQAAFEPQFPPSDITPRDFVELRSQLVLMFDASSSMKQFVVDHFDAQLTDIQRKLIAHAASLRDASPSAKVPDYVPFVPNFGLYDHTLNDYAVSSRKSVLERAKEYLGVLQTAAKTPENQKTLGDSVSEITTLSKLLPTNLDAPKLDEAPAPAPDEPLNAQKVADRLQQFKLSVKEAILSSWALDTELKQVEQMAETEQKKSLNAEVEVHVVAGELHLLMAASIAAGMLLGTFFLLIGDWTKKSSTEVLYYWRALLPDFKDSPSNIYTMIEEAVRTREIPGLEISRQFWHEGGALSQQREYLRFARERQIFDICAAPFGTGFFISYRASIEPPVIDPLAICVVLMVVGISLAILAATCGFFWGCVWLVLGLTGLILTLRASVARGLGDMDRTLRKTPLLGPLYELYLRPITYYRIDSMEMYVLAMQAAVSEAFEEIFGDKGFQLLPGTIEKPIMDDLFRKRLI